MREELFERPQSTFLGRDVAVDDVNGFISARDDASEFCIFLKELHEEIIERFGPTTATHLVVYKPSPDSTPKQWELLLEIQSGCRPGDFVDKINEFSFPDFDKYPIDICRYCKNRRVNFGNTNNE